MNAVHTPRADQGRIKPLDEVGGHEDHALLPGADTVDGVQQAGEGNAATARLVARAPLHERGVDVLEQDDCLLWDV